jgi:hypothetical protein
MTIGSAPPQGPSRRQVRGAQPPAPPRPPAGLTPAAPPRYPTFDTPRSLVQVPAAAGLGPRIAAWLIDLAVVAVVTVGAWLLTGSVLVTVIVAVEILVGLAVWEGHTGSTFGQLALGLRTVRAGTAVSAGAPRAFPRALVFGASHLVVVGPLVLLLTATADRSRRRQAWHDRIGDLQVIDVRRTEFVPAEQEPPSRAAAPYGAVPPGAAPYGGTQGTGHAAGGTTPRAAGAGARGPAPALAAPAGGAPVPPPGPARPPVPPPPPAPEPAASPAPTAAAAPAAPPAVAAPMDANPPARRRSLPQEPVAEQSARTEEEAGLPLHTMLPREAVTRFGQPERRRRSSSGAPSAPAGPVPAFRTDDGTVTPVDRLGYIGRRPSAPDEHPDALLVTVPDEDRSVSRSHGRFGVTNGQLWYEDLGSGNGSILELPDGRSTTLTSHQRVSLPTDSKLIIGSHTVRIVEHRG